MNKKILIGSIIAVTILIGVSFTSVVGYRSVASDVKASPLFNIRTSRAIDEEEKGLRCEMCIRERLRETARAARDRGFDAFAAVLTVSPHKDAAMVNRLGAEAGEEFGIEYVATDLKKQDGFKKSVELSKKLGIYRQDYCGCEFSKRKDTGPRTQDTE